MMWAYRIVKGRFYPVPIALGHAYLKFIFITRRHLDKGYPAETSRSEVSSVLLKNL